MAGTVRPRTRRSQPDADHPEVSSLCQPLLWQRPLAPWARGDAHDDHGRRVSGLACLVAIFENEFYVATRNYLFQFDATTWSWIHLLIGLIVTFAGYGLLSGRT